MGLIPKPDWLSDDDQWVNQGEKYAPVLTLPDGRIFAPVQKRTDVTPQSIIGKCGVIGVMNYSAPDAVRHGFHHANDLRAGVANKGDFQAHLMTRDEVRALAFGYPILPVEGNDFGEGNFYFAPDSQQALWWYQARREKFMDPTQNPNGVVRRDYGHHGCVIALQGTNGPWLDNTGGPKLPTDPYFRGRYASVAAARSGIGYFLHGIDGIPYEQLVGCNVKHYAETYDYARNYYSKKMAMQIMGKGMGKVGGLGPGFLVYNDWGKIEGLGGTGYSVNGNHYYERPITTPGAEGVVKSLAHPQISYDFEVGTYLICGFLYGDGVTTFDRPTRYGVDPSKMVPTNFPATDNLVTVQWIPKNGNTPAPVTQEGYPDEPNRWHDAGYEAAYYYSKMNRTEGVGWSACAWRFAGSETWFEPEADGADVLVAAAAFDGVNATSEGARRGRPTVDARVKNKAFDFVAFDPSRGKSSRERIFVRAPNGQVFESVLQGCKVNAHNETLN